MTEYLMLLVAPGCALLVICAIHLANKRDRRILEQKASKRPAWLEMIG